VRHELHLVGYAFRLRPVAESDAAFIANLRQRRGRFLNQGASSTAGQLEWMARYFRRAGDFYFVIEALDGDRREGLVGIYGLDPQIREAEWGRWVLEPGSSAAVESALLVYRCAFDKLALERVWCRTLADHLQVISFHDSCGLERLPGIVTIDHDGAPSAAVEHRLTRNDWPHIHARLESLAVRAAGAARPTAQG
jgi:RimJ/RimL family protein N-acetyltransferase